MDTDRTHILTSEPSDETALAAFAEAVDRLGPEAGGPWKFANVQEGAGQLAQIWRSPRQADLILTDDMEVNLRYLNLYGLPPDAAAAALDALSRAVGFRTREELLREASEGDNDQALYALGLAGGSPDPAAVKLIATALQAADPGRRQIAAEAAALARWPDLAEPLKVAAAKEENEDLVRLMTYAAGRSR